MPNPPSCFTDGSCWSQVLSAFRTGAARGTKQIMENLEMQILEALSTEDWTETLQVAKAVGKSSKSHWVLDCRWLWFQKQITRFWTPKMLTLKNSCIWIVLRQDHPVARQKKHAPWNHPFSKDHCDAFNPCEKFAAQAKWIQLFISWNLRAKCWKIQPQNHDGKPSFQVVMVLSATWCFLVWRFFWFLCCVRIFVPIVWKKEVLLWCGTF